MQGQPDPKAYTRKIDQVAQRVKAHGEPKVTEIKAEATPSKPPPHVTPTMWTRTKKLSTGSEAFANSSFDWDSQAVLVHVARVEPNSAIARAQIPSKLSRKGSPPGVTES